MGIWFLAIYLYISLCIQACVGVYVCASIPSLFVIILYLVSFKINKLILCYTWFFEITFVRMLVCFCVCVPTPDVININDLDLV